MSFEDFSQEPTIYSLISAFKSSSEPQDVAENATKVTSVLMSCSIKNAEDLFKHMMPTITQTMRLIYNRNNSIIKAGSNESLESIKSNLQVALKLTNSSGEIMEYILKHENVSVGLIPSVPVNMAQVLLLTFEHCKNSQKIYQSTLKSVNEILELFKKTQEVHCKFLNLLDTCLIFDCLSENEMIIFKNVLDVIIKISEMLTEVNTKSMADNWKGFITLIQKYSKNLDSDCSYLSSAIRSLTSEIDHNMQTVYDLGLHDLKKSLQILKLNGFLVKVILKLFEINLCITENFKELISFCVVIYSWHPDFFRTNNFSPELVKTVDDVLYVNTESFVCQLFSESDFVQNFSSLNENSELLLQHGFGFLNFANKFLKNVPRILVDNAEVLENDNILALFHLFFNISKNCYKEFLYDFNSSIYQEFVVNISVAVLLFPDIYSSVEKILLNSVVQDEVWTAMIAIDVWCTVLRQSSTTLRRSTLKILINKIQELNAGIFVQTPVVIYLKFLAQRIFKTLPNNIINEEVSVYSPSENSSVWKLLNLGDIPLSQRFHIEFLLTDVYNKIEEKENSSVNDIIALVEYMDIISNAAFNDLEINTTRLALNVNNLWSFNVCEIPSSNNFLKYFIHKLSKITTAIINDMTTEHLILVIIQLKQLFIADPLFKLLACDIIQAISKRNLNSSSERVSLFSILLDTMQTLLTDKNLVIVQIALETFSDLSENDTYVDVINKIVARPDIKKLIVNFMGRKAAHLTYNVKFLEKISRLKLQHCCLAWTNSDLPPTKKLKVDSSVDEAITNLKNNSENLTKSVSKSDLSTRQLADIKCVIRQLETLVV